MKRFRCWVLSAAIIFSVLSPFSHCFAADTAHAYYWRTSINVQGHDAYCLLPDSQLYPINLNGNVYVPIDTVEEWTASTITYDPNAATITWEHEPYGSPQYWAIDDTSRPSQEEFNRYISGKNEGFDVTVLTGARVLTDLPDGDLSFREVETVNEQGTVLWPVFYENKIYLSVRTVAKVMSWDVLYLERPRIAAGIFLYSKPSAAQLQDVQNYLAQMKQYADDLEADLAASQELIGTITADQFKDHVAAIRDRIVRYRDLSLPSASVFWETIQDNNSFIEGDIRQLETYLRPVPSGWTLNDYHREFVGVMSTNFLYHLKNCIENLQGLVDGVIANS